MRSHAVIDLYGLDEFTASLTYKHIWKQYNSLTHSVYSHALLNGTNPGEGAFVQKPIIKGSLVSEVCKQK